MRCHKRRGRTDQIGVGASKLRITLSSMTKHGAVPVVGSSHVTVTKFAFFAEERPAKKLQDPGLSVPGISHNGRPSVGWGVTPDMPLVARLRPYTTRKYMDFNVSPKVHLSQERRR